MVNNQRRKPDFYLASTDGYGLDTPTRCWRIRALRSSSGNDLMLVNVDPPILHFSLSWDQVALASRHKGKSVLHIREWPHYVDIAVASSGGFSDSEFIKDQEIESIAWGELYPTEEAAGNK